MTLNKIYSNLYDALTELEHKQYEANLAYESEDDIKKKSKLEEEHIMLSNAVSYLSSCLEELEV